MHFHRYASQETLRLMGHPRINSIVSQLITSLLMMCDRNEVENGKTSASPRSGLVQQ